MMFRRAQEITPTPDLEAKSALPQDGYITRMGRWTRGTALGAYMTVMGALTSVLPTSTTAAGGLAATGGVVVATAACSGGGGGSNPTQPPNPTNPYTVTLNFSDYVPVSAAADGGRAVSVTVNGKATDMGHVTIDGVLPTTQLCIEGGSHVKTHAGGSQCFSYSQGGGYDEKLVRGDMGAAWATGDAARFDPSQKKALADKSVFSGKVGTINAGFADAAACAHGAQTAVDIGAISSFPPPGYDFGIIAGAGFYDGSRMTLPANVTRLQAAGEGLRPFGIFGDYGGFEQGFNKCAPQISYMTAAVNAGAPR